MITEPLYGGLELFVELLRSVKGLASIFGLAALVAQFGVQLNLGDLRRTTREYNLITRWLLANLLFLPLVAGLFAIVFSLPEPEIRRVVIVRNDASHAVKHLDDTGGCRCCDGRGQGTFEFSILLAVGPNERCIGVCVRSNGERTAN